MQVTAKEAQQMGLVHEVAEGPEESAPRKHCWDGVRKVSHKGVPINVWGVFVLDFLTHKDAQQSSPPNDHSVLIVFV